MDVDGVIKSEPIDGEALGDLGLLIEIMKSYTFLFDKKSRDYKNPVKKERAWREISEIVQMSVDDCQRQWRNLRDRFTREKRQLKSGSELPESNWLYMDKMMFYAQYTTPRKTAIKAVTRPTNLPTTTTTTSRPTTPSWSCMDTVLSPTASLDGGQLQSDEEQGVLEEPQVLEEFQVFEEPQEELPTMFEEVEVTDTKRFKETNKRKREDFEAVILNVAEQVSEALTKTRASNSANSNKKFCEYVYARLEEMSLEEAREKRKNMIMILEQ